MAAREESGYEDGDYSRPRRPNADTISYLRSLPLDIQASSDEVTRYLSDKDDATTEYPQSLSAAIAAIDEIRNEVASLAGDEFGSQCIEILTRIAAPYSEVAARTLLLGLAGYHVHLATHRYGSHVVQTILQLAVSTKSDTDFAKYEESPQITGQDELPPLSELIVGVVDELAPFASQLAVHVCGSHVLRTLLCVLGGVELVSPPGKQHENPFMESGALRRGRVKNKKKKKKKPDAGDNATQHAGMMHMVYISKPRLDEASQEALSQSLQSLTEALSANQMSVDGPGELQKMACHPSAGPLLIVLLRVLTYSSRPKNCRPVKNIEDENRCIADHRLGILQPEPTFELNSAAHSLAERILCLQATEPASKQKYAGDVIYGLSGEPRGSHLLETLLRTSPDEIYACILECGDFTNPSALKDYVEHDVSNFVIQSLLNTTRSKEQAEVLLKGLEHLISSGYVLDPPKKRRAVLWKAVEMAAKYRVGQDTLLKSIRLGFATLAEKNDVLDLNSATDGPKEPDEEGRKKKKRRRKASSMSIQDCVKQLIDVRAPGRDGRVIIDVAGARTIHNLLCFSPRLCGDVLDGIVGTLSEDELEWIVKDGLGSRCIMDGIFENPSRKEVVFVKATKDILAKLSGRWVALSVERVGHHTVKKLFWSLPDMNDQALLAAELAQGMTRLSGNAMGRAVMDECCLRDFTEGEQAWKDAVTKKQQRDGWLKHIGGEDKEKPNAVKKKRKRKRHKASGASETEDRDGEHEGPKQQKTSVVASIMNTISVPAK